jgi:hypothetical protein
MALKDKKTGGGSGGKRGHSNMTHWEYTEAIKKEAKRARRVQDKFACTQEYTALYVPKG